MLIARRSLITGAAALVSCEALAQVPGITPQVGLISGAVMGTTWNPSDAGSRFTFSNSNRTWSLTSSSQIVRATTSRAAGKMYFEVLAISVADNMGIGIAQATASLGFFLGGDSGGIGYANSGTVYSGFSSIGSYSSYTAGDRISVAVDFTSNKLFFAKNGTWQGSSNPSTGSGGLSITAGQTLFAASGTNGSSGTSSCTANFGASAFTYTVPSGFVAWG